MFRRSRNAKNDKGDYETRTEWHRVYARRNLSKFAKTLQKGQLITREGTLRYREVEDESSRDARRTPRTPVDSKVGRWRNRGTRNYHHPQHPADSRQNCWSCKPWDRRRDCQTNPAKQFGQEDDITVVIIERSVAAEESSRAGIKPKLVPASFLMGRRDAFSLWSRSLATIHLGLGKLGSYARV